MGALALRVGGPGGTVVEAERAAPQEGVAELRRALEGPAPPGAGQEGDFAAGVDDAAKATSQVERAVSLCQGVAEGRALDLDQLGLEVGALLDCLEKLDRRKEHRKALRMARAVATLLMLLKRWADLLRTLRLALGLARELGDLEAVAWAEHEIGTLRLAAGDLEGADRDLCEAKEIRERIGDRRGLAATDRNLGALCRQLRQMLRREELVRRPGRRPPAARRAVFAAVVAFAFAIAGFAAGSLVGSDDSRPASAADNGGPATPGDGPGPDAGPDSNPGPGTDPGADPDEDPDPDPGDNRGTDSNDTETGPNPKLETGPGPEILPQEEEGVPGLH